MHRLLLPVLALLASSPLASPAPAPGPGPVQPARQEAEKAPAPGYHLGSFSSLRSGRLGSDGRIDSGAAVITLGDGENDLVFDRVGYGHGPTLVGQFSGRLRGLLVEGVSVCAGISGGGDERGVVALQLKITNESRERARLPLVVSLHPGGGDPSLRPVPSLELQPETRFELVDERLITRDGHALLRWLAGDPKVEVFERVGSAWDTAARLTFELDIPAGVGRYVELELAGAPMEPTADEEAWRASFVRRTFRDLEEGLRWQWQVRGRFANFTSPVAALDRTLVASVHMLRSFGIAHRAASALSDRPYGQPPRDAAVESEVLGVLMMLNFDEISASQLDRLVEGLETSLQGLSPERRLAYLYGLVQSMRLGTLDEQSVAVAQAVLDHVETVPVRPWFDPDVVRADLAAFVTEAGLEGADELPELEWATVDDADSIAGRVLAMRRAMSAGDVEAAWTAFESVLHSSWRGMGAWEEGGELDGRYALAVLNLARELLVDDHGDALVLFPRVPSALVERGAGLHMDFMPTRFGQIRAQLYTVGRKNVGIWTRFVPGAREAPLFGRLPAGLHPRRLLGKPTGGEAQIQEDGSIRLWIDEIGAGGLRLSAGVGSLDG